MKMKNKQDSIDDHTQSLNHKELNLVPVSHLAGFLDIYNRCTITRAVNCTGFEKHLSSKLFLPSFLYSRSFMRLSALKIDLLMVL